jgi:hypothetical protein
MKYFSIVVSVCLLTAISGFSNELPNFHYPSGGEIINCSDSLEIVFDNSDSSLTGFSLYIWKQSVGLWLKLNDNVILNNGKFKIKLPLFENPYARFKIVDNQNNNFSVSNYFTLQSFAYKVNNQDFTELKSNEDLLVYPNPVNDFLTIQLYEKIEMVMLYNILGNHFVISCIGNKIDFSSISAGVYLLYIQTSNHSYIRQVIKH